MIRRSNNIDIKPFISTIVVTRNEQEYIKRALLSLIDQTYPHDRYEIIIVDGESTDSTLDIVNEIIKESKPDGTDILIFSNPKLILASGWNIGIKKSRGEYVVRIDAHSEVFPEFLKLNVETITSLGEDVACVGGRMTTKPLEGKENAISKVLSSPFGVGNSSFRVSNKKGYSDTAVYGLYKKEVFDKVGLFNEFYVRNQDVELHSRIKQAGLKFYFNPEIKSIYYSRNTVKKMINQALGNGKWNMVLLKSHRSALSIRHLVPLVFVLFLIITSFMGIYAKEFWILEGIVILLHLSLGWISAVKMTSDIAEIMVMPVLFLLLHISYGIGYLTGIFIRPEGS